MSDVMIRNLKAGYGDKIIYNGFDIDFKAGETTVLLGNSGVGKSTLLNILAGLKSYEGEISGLNRNGIAYIFQKDRLIPAISIFKNLELVLSRVYKDKAERKKLIFDMLELLSIADKAYKLPRELSGGEAQRAAMARAFLYPSEVLLLDEPFKALDTALKARLIFEMERINEADPRTIIFVTHAIDECLLAADNYFVLEGSPVKIAANGRIDLPKSERRLTSPLLNGAREELLKIITGEVLQI